MVNPLERAASSVCVCACMRVCMRVCVCVCVCVCSLLHVIVGNYSLAIIIIIAYKAYDNNRELAK